MHPIKKIPTQFNYATNQQHKSSPKKTITRDCTHHYKLTVHLGNVRVTFNENGNILQEDSYYPFGMLQNGMSYQTSNNNYNKNNYLYNGKELQTDFDLNWYDYGARFYDPQLGRWHVPDPMAESRNWLSSYQYTQNTPINRIDPNGMLDDWIKNKETEEYEWRDDVTSEDDTPEGYEYIGASNNDILDDLGIQSKHEAQTANIISGGLDENRGGSAFIGTNTDVTGNITVKADVSFNIEKGTDNNVMGKQFEGITVKASMSQEAFSPNSDLKMEYKGHFEVKVGDESVTYNPPIAFDTFST